MQGSGGGTEVGLPLPSIRKGTDLSEEGVSLSCSLQSGFEVKIWIGTEADWNGWGH